MRNRPAGVIAGVTVTVLLLTTSPAAAALGPKWIAGPDLAPAGVTGSRWLDISATSPADIWAVGASTGSVTSPLIGHYDGAAWTTVAAPAAPKSTRYSLAAVDAVAPGDVWAAGSVVGASSAGLILHYDGAWSVASADEALPAAKSALADVDMLSATDGWAVGSTVPTGKPAQALIERYQAGQWVRTPAQLGDFTSTALSAVYARSAGDAWAVGTATRLNGKQAALVVHWNGSDWQPVAVPDGGGAAEAESLAGVAGTAADDVWAAGRICAAGVCRPLVLHLAGQRWAVVPTAGGATELTEVVPFTPADVWIVGYASGAAGDTDHAEHWDGHVFTGDGPPPADPGGPATTDAEPASAIEGATAVPGTGAVWAVGWSRDPLLGASHVMHRD